MSGYPMSTVSVNLQETSLTPVKEDLVTSGSSAAFAPIPGRQFNVVHRRSNDFSGSYQLEKKFTDDADWYIAINSSDVVDLPEVFSLQEDEFGVSYRWTVISRTSGTLTVRISA